MSSPGLNRGILKRVRDLARSPELKNSYDKLKTLQAVKTDDCPLEIIHNKWIKPPTSTFSVGSPLPRLEFEQHFQSRQKNTMYIAPEGFGKTSAVCSYLANISYSCLGKKVSDTLITGNQRVYNGFPGAIYVPLRYVHDEADFYRVLSKSIGVTDKLSPSDTLEGLLAVVDRFQVMHKQPLKIIFDDLDAGTLTRTQLGNERFMTVNVSVVLDLLMHMWLTHKAIVFLFASTAQAKDLLIKSVQGAEYHFDFEYLPYTSRDWLRLAMCSTFWNAERKQLSLIPYELLVDATDEELDTLSTTWQDQGYNHVFQATKDIDYLLDHVGSNYGDLMHALRGYAAHRGNYIIIPNTLISSCANFIYFLDLHAAVDSVVNSSRYTTKLLSCFWTDVDDTLFTPAQFQLVAYRLFDRLANVASSKTLASEDHWIDLNVAMPELDTMAVSPRVQHSIVLHVQTMGIVSLTFSYTVDTVVRFSSQAFAHAWRKVRNSSTVQDTMKEAFHELGLNMEMA